MELEFKVEAKDEGLRLDQFLSQQVNIPSRAYAHQLIESAAVRLVPFDKKIKPSTRLQMGTSVFVSLPEKQNSSLQAWAHPLDIFYEDDELLVINKEAGMVVHPSAGHSEKTLVHALLAHCGDFRMGLNEERPGIVHRLDRDTSGLIVVAKTPFSHEKLSEQFRRRQVERFYWALCAGKPPHPSGYIESHIARHPVHRKKMASRQDGSGKYAKTEYHCLASWQSISLLRFKLYTGRTHQIRVHCSENGFPILNDPHYAHRNRYRDLLGVKKFADLQSLPRFFLHAAVLGFTHPVTGKKLRFYASIPKELKPWTDSFQFTPYIVPEAFDAGSL